MLGPCDPAGTRTQDPYIKSVLLYQLSYGIRLRLPRRRILLTETCAFNYLISSDRLGATSDKVLWAILKEIDRLVLRHGWWPETNFRGFDYSLPVLMAFP
jgi:hypothetical protein